MGEIWGPWIEHDGKGCPVPNGTIAHCVWNSRYELVAAVTANGRRDLDNPWVWIDDRPNIIRYRIRKPKGLTILESVLREVEREDA